MSKYFILIFLFLYGCSLNPNSKFWSETKKANVDNSVSKVLFKSKKPNESEFNQQLKITLPKVKKYKFDNLSNNDGFVNFLSFNENLSKYKFNRIEKFSSFEPELLVSNNSLIFFDDKGTLIKFNELSKVLWKKNYYSKSDKKSQPILFLASENNNIFVADTAANYYVVDDFTGDLKWKKKHSSSFNSQIKIKNGKVFVVDLENTLRCFSIKDGKTIWSVPTDLTIVSSQKKQSIIIDKNIVYFTNSIGDITAVDFETGEIIWQTPTQNIEFSTNITLRTSDLITDGETLFFSNNKNEFFAIDMQTGILKWKQEINSELRPVTISNYIVTVTNEGLLVVLDKNNGNILRINDILKNIKQKKRKEYLPSGFIIGSLNLYLSTNNGRLFIINFKDSKIDKILKLDKEKIQRPVFFKGKLYIAKDNSIIKMN